MSILTAAAGLLGVLQILFRGLGNGLAVSHLRLPHIGVHFKFAGQTIHDNFCGVCARRVLLGRRFDELRELDKLGVSARKRPSLLSQTSILTRGWPSWPWKPE